MRNIQVLLGCSLFGATLATPALAEQAGLDLSAGVSASDGDTSATSAADASASTVQTSDPAPAPAPAAPVSAEPSKSYMERYLPEANLMEMGLFGGVIFPSKRHELYDPHRAFQKYGSAAPELGMRVGYYPLSFLGVEAEGAVMPTSTKDDKSAGLWAVRGHGVLQLPIASLVPFLLIGGGVLGAGSDSLGSDADPAVHFGAGLKAPLDDFLSVRLDVRDTMSQKGQAEDGAQTHHPEILLGLTFTLDRSKPVPPPPPDTDNDGIIDSADACPTEAGPAPAGCPPPPDADGDGVLDRDDQCPAEAGPAPTGCPPPLDSDGDGVPDPDDACPQDKGPAPKGCPDLDPDQDGIPGDADKCPNEAETRNGFEDTDGCPDELPEAVKRFTGVIQGIEFEFGKAGIRPVSRTVLDGAASLLKEYPDLRVLITGHTDNVGPRERNLELSGKRAEAVKQYLVDHGIDAARIETRGAGPDEPIADNAAPGGAQKNRRIEFKVLTQ